MRLLMLNYEFPPIGGGAGGAHLSLLQEYAQETAFDVDVLTSGLGRGVTTESFAKHITIHRVGLNKPDLHYWRRSEVLQWLWRARRVYRGLLQKQSYDLVHAFFGFPTGWLCYRTASQVPYVISLRGSDVPGQNSRLKLDYAILGALVFKPIWRRAAALVACSAGLRDRALRFLPAVDVQVIPNGVDLTRFHVEAKKRSFSEGPCRLLTVGRLSSTKRVDLLVRAVARLHQAHCPVHLTVVGGGSLEQALRDQIQAADLGEHVTLLGRVVRDDMPEIYRRHDILVSATVQEGMSNAMLEGMASGLPIITTPCEGVAELVSDNGMVLDHVNDQAMAQAIVDLVNDPDRYTQMATCARQQAERFTWKAVADQYRQCYQAIVGETCR